jgi:hypothetical protein
LDRTISDEAALPRQLSRAAKYGRVTFPTTPGLFLPFSDSPIFLDTEFTSFDDPVFISIGLVVLEGNESVTCGIVGLPLRAGVGVRA